MIPDVNELTLEVADLEDGCARLSGCALQFGAVDLREALAVQVLPEEVADRVLEPEYSLVGLCPEVDHTVVQTGVEQDTLELDVLGLSFCRLRTVGVIDSKRQDGLQTGDQVQL